MIGGINGGRLGLYDKITFSGTTALRVTSSEKFNAPMYLRGYAAESYHDNSWDPIKIDGDVKDALKADKAGQSVLDLGYNAIKELYPFEGDRSLDIKVINAVSDIIYAPYNADLSGCDEVGTQKYDGIAKAKSKDYSLNYYYENGYDWGSIVDDTRMGFFAAYGEVSFQNGNIWGEALNGYTHDEQFAYSQIPDGLKSYGESVYNRSEYFEVPEEIDPTISAIGDSIGLSGSSSAVYNAQLIRRYFEREGFYYTKEPGVTPEGEDFIQYFLTRQHKGYCTYYASAGVMLMRHAGFPARYVEGYVIEPSQFVSSDESIRVSDRCAHAWCEVYIDGLGWYPFEFTPGYEQDNPNLTDEEKNIGKPESSSSSRANSSSKTDGSSSRSQNGSGADNTSRSGDNSSRSSSAASVSQAGDSSQADSNGGGIFAANTSGGSGGAGGGIKITPSAVYAFVLILFALIFCAAAAVRRKTRLAKLEKRLAADPDTAVIACYLSYLEYISLVGISSGENVSDAVMADKLFEKLKSFGAKNARDFMRLSDLAVASYMSGAEADEQDAEFSRGALNAIRNAVYERLSFFKRFGAKWIYNLY